MILTMDDGTEYELVEVSGTRTFSVTLEEPYKHFAYHGIVEYVRGNLKQYTYNSISIDGKLYGAILKQ